MAKIPLDLAALEVGARVQDPLLVWHVDRRSLPDGQPFTVLQLSNNTGRIATAPFWPEHLNQVAGIARGQVVQVIGEVETYRDRKQLRVTSIRVMPKQSVDLSRLLPSVGDTSPYWETLDRWRHRIAKPRLARVLDLFYEDDDFRADFGTCPASVGRHAALGGLLARTVQVTAIARALARAVRADSDIVLAGALLRDIGKLRAFTWSGMFAHEDAGRLVGHVALGLLMFEERLSEQAEPPCTAEERDLLRHMIVAHRPLRGRGAGVPPMTLEADVVYQAVRASRRVRAKARAIHEGGPGDASAISRARSDWGA